MIRDPYVKASWERRPHGHIIIDGVEIASTKQCCHCGRHYTSIRGSGIKRGFCLKCMGPTCGKPRCDRCIPHRAWLEHWEGKKTKYTPLILEIER